MGSWRLKLAKWLINGLPGHWELAVAISNPPGQKLMQFRVYYIQTTDENLLFSTDFTVSRWLDLRQHMQEAVWHQDREYELFEERIRDL